MAAGERFSKNTIRHALKNWHSLDELGAHPLATLAIVAARRRAAGYSDSAAGTGLALRDQLDAALLALRPDPGEPLPADRRWRAYVILREQFINHRRPDWVAGQLFVSRRTYYEEQERALLAVADWLRQREERHAAVPGDNAWAPADAAPAAPPFLAPPRPAHRLVGRDDLLAVLTARLTAAEPAVVALHGLPGAGKTALAAELAHRLAPLARYADGVLWTGIGRQPDVTALLGRWAAAVGVSDDRLAAAGTPAARAAALHAAIGRRRFLLVIDDAWHIEQALLFKVGGPACSYLLTTRSPQVALDFAGDGALAVHELTPHDGLALLAELAPQAVQAEQAEAASLVAAVGSLPLALLLIGRHLRRQGYGTQARRLQRALVTLRATEARLQLTQPQSPLEQHPGLPAGTPLSLNAAIGLSDMALAPPARQALRALALFPPKPNSFSEEAALAVTEAAPEWLDALVDHGLLEPMGDDRYTLHQTIADYAQVGADSAESRPTTAADRFVRHFLAFADARTRDFAALDRELDNLLAALDLCLAQARYADLTAGSLALASFLITRGLYNDAQHYLTHAFAAARDGEGDSAESLPRLHYQLGLLARRQDQHAAAHDHFEQALAQARAAGLITLEIDLLRNLGNLAVRRDEPEDGRAYYRRGLALAQTIGDISRQAAVLNNLGLTYYQVSDYDAARTHYEEALALREAIGERHEQRFALHNLGVIYAEQADYATARHYYERVLAIHRELGDIEGLGLTYNALGLVAKNLGEWPEAIRLFDQSLQLRRQINHQTGIGIASANLGIVYMQQGDYARAEALFERGLTVARQSANRLAEGRALDNLSTLATLRGRYEAGYEYALATRRVAHDLANRQLEGFAELSLGEACTGLHRWEAAHAALTAALAVWTTLRRPHLAVQTRGALAALWLARDDPAQAGPDVAVVLAYLDAHSTAGLTDPAQLFVTCLTWLARTGGAPTGDARAAALRARAHAYLTRQAARIDDPATRRLFLEQVTANRRLLRLLDAPSSR